MVLQLQFDQVLVEIISSEFKVPLTVSATVINLVQYLTQNLYLHVHSDLQLRVLRGVLKSITIFLIDNYQIPDPLLPADPLIVVEPPQFHL